MTEQTKSPSIASPATVWIEPSNPSTSVNDVEATLVAWWEELLGLETVRSDDDFFDLGGDSLIGVQLFFRIKKTYGREFGLSTLFEARTVRHLAQLIRETGETQAVAANIRSSIVPIQPNGTQPPVFWIPGGFGNSVLPFREVSLELGADQPVYGFESKMPEEGEEFEPIANRAVRFIDEMRTLQPHGPYSLIGFCGGGYVAYEMAQQLSAQGEKIALLCIVECDDPRHPSGQIGRICFRAERIVWRIRNFLRRGPRSLARWTAEKVSSAARWLRFRGQRGLARLVGEDLPEPPSPAADMFAVPRSIIFHYKPAPYRGKAVIILGKDTWNFAGLSSSIDPRLVWRQRCLGGSEVHR
ncbi:MAG: thioesterase domain-containing protein, partial [Candidatus Acidiferrales bacterium]